jgi:hypothetical protein
MAPSSQPAAVEIAANDDQVECSPESVRRIAAKGIGGSTARQTESPWRSAALNRQRIGA